MASAATLRAQDTPAEAALRKALREASTQNSSLPAASQPASAPATAATPVGNYDPLIQALRTQPGTTSAYDSSGLYGSVPGGSANQDVLVNALRTQPGTTSAPTIAATPQTSVPPPSVSPEPAAKPAPAPTAKKASASAGSGFAPIQPPALPISASKEQRLESLLADYKADRITPEEYHKQRAAILAEP